MSFEFLDPGKLKDGDLELRLANKRPANPARKRAPCYEFEMIHAETGRLMGLIDLRVGDSENLRLYGGHIGYGVDPAFRGHHYAARSVRLLLPLAKRHDMGTVWITCNPDNPASARSCELAGGVYVETVTIPENTDLYREGDREKMRFRFDL